MMSRFPRPALTARAAIALTGFVLLHGGGLVRAEQQQASASASQEAQALIRELDAQDRYARQVAFLRLEALREPSTAETVQRYLTSADAFTRVYAVRALAAIQGVRALPILLERLKTDRSPDVRVAAILAIEPLDDPSVLPALLERLRDPRPDVRMAAADVVSRFDDPQARAAILTRSRRERHRDVRRVLEQAVARMASPSG